MFCTDPHCRGIHRRQQLWLQQMQKATDCCFPITWASRGSIPSATPQLPRISEKQQLLLGSWPWSQPTPTLHPSHSFTGWSYFHNRSLDTFPALSTPPPPNQNTWKQSAFCFISTLSPSPPNTQTCYSSCFSQPCLQPHWAGPSIWNSF